MKSLRGMKYLVLLSSLLYQESTRYSHLPLATPDNPSMFFVLFTYFLFSTLKLLPSFHNNNIVLVTHFSFQFTLSHSHTVTLLSLSLEALKASQTVQLSLNQ